MDSINKCYSTVNFSDPGKKEKVQNAEGIKIQAYINGH